MLLAESFIANSTATRDTIAASWRLLDPNPAKHAHLESLCGAKMRSYRQQAAKGEKKQKNIQDSNHQLSSTASDGNGNGDEAPVVFVSTTQDLDALLFLPALHQRFHPDEWYDGVGFFTRLAQHYPAEVNRFIQTVNVLLPLALDSGILTKNYPLMRIKKVEECHDCCCSSSSGEAIQSCIRQSFSLCRLEIALLNLLSAFGYSRQGYPHTAPPSDTYDTSKAYEHTISKYDPSRNEPNHLDANEFNLLRFFTTEENPSHHVYALTLMGYLDTIAAEYNNNCCSSNSTAAAVLTGGGGENNDETTTPTLLSSSSPRDCLLTEQVVFTRVSSPPSAAAYERSTKPLCDVLVLKGSMFECADHGDQILAKMSKKKKNACKNVSHSDGNTASAEAAEKEEENVLLCNVVTDYANEYYGGPCTLTSTQEEILLMLKPEMLPARQLCEVMMGHEAIVVERCRLFSAVTGYGRSTRIASVLPPVLTASRSHDSNAWDVAVIDAITNDPSSPEWDQFTAANRLRCTHKAFLAFEQSVKVRQNTLEKVQRHGSDDDNHEKNIQRDSRVAIAGGRWGCGVFNGDLFLKVLQQWVAASEAGASRLDLYLFDDPLEPSIEAMVASWEGATVGDLFKATLSSQAVGRDGNTIRHTREM